jgi:3'-5' exoribonuclease
MPRRFIADLVERENVDQIFLAAEKQLRTNRNGNHYLQIRLSDRTGCVTGMMWNGGDAAYGTFDNGDYLRVQATAQIYNGALQLIVNKLEKAPLSKIDESDFITLGPAQVDALAARMAQMLRGVANSHLRNLAECFLIDEAFMRKFTRAPAGVKNHHAYHGGLLEHVVSLMELAAVVAPRYPSIDPELLLFGAFLHDMGKIDELTYEPDLAYSDEGQLLGHVILAISMLDEKLKQAESLGQEEFPPELAMRLKHMIVSHHGEYEFGSPKLPMTLEAIALHYLDNLDAKIHTLGQLMREDANTDSNWTPFQPSLNRKIFKGQRQT